MLDSLEQGSLEPVVNGVLLGVRPVEGILWKSDVHLVEMRSILGGFAADQLDDIAIVVGTAHIGLLDRILFHLLIFFVFGFDLQGIRRYQFLFRPQNELDLSIPIELPLVFLQLVELRALVRHFLQA